MNSDRRTFLKMLAGTGIATAIGLNDSALADVATLPGYPDQFGVLVDTTVCIGCRRCEWACKESNELPNQMPLKKYEKDQAVFRKDKADQCRYVHCGKSLRESAGFFEAHLRQKTVHALLRTGVRFLLFCESLHQEARGRGYV